ncbi:MAG: hypothetical protein A2Y02_01015 [Omnitrophica bacterium GWA2_52_12]|nr:MAG: hypothetical protein A2Y02_01015 [Omnitrophica bacterium GWA2_52_12]
MKRRILVFLLLMGCASSVWAMGSLPWQTKKEVQSATPASEIQTITLWDGYELALRQSEALAIKKEEIDRTLASFLKATGDAVGDFDFVMTTKRQDPQAGSSDGSAVAANATASERRERKFVISQPLFQGFKSVGALSGAGSLRKQRQQEWERAKQLLFIDVATTFYDYLRIQKDIEITQGILTLYEDRIKELRGWEEIGRSRPSETASAQSHYEVFRADLARFKGELEIVENMLSFLTGMPVQPIELKDETSAPASAEIDFAELAAARPDVEAARQAVTTARGAMIVAQGDLWPELSLDSNLYEKREGFQSGISWDALFTLSIPLGKGGSTFSKMRDAISLWKQAKLTYAMNQRKAEQEIRDAYTRWMSAGEQYRALEKAVKSAQENFTLQSNEYKQHLVSNLDVLEAMQALFETKRNLNLVFYMMTKSYWQLEVARGNCCKELQSADL